MSVCQCSKTKKRTQDTRSYQRASMQKDRILEKLRERGLRITKQRLTIIDIILENDCSCCKEIYYKASKMDSGIGTATVYRMVNTLEEIGAISRKNMYKIGYSNSCSLEDACQIVLDDETVYYLTAKDWNAVIQEGLRQYGYLDGDQNIVSVTVKECECPEESHC